MKNKKPEKTFGEINKEFEQAYRNGWIEREIKLAEQLGHYSFAGNRAREFGLYKKAIDNFKKCKEGVPNSMLKSLNPKKNVSFRELNEKHLTNQQEFEERMKVTKNFQEDTPLNEREYYYLPSLIKFSN